MKVMQAKDMSSCGSMRTNETNRIEDHSLAGWHIGRLAGGLAGWIDGRLEVWWWMGMLIIA